MEKKRVVILGSTGSIGQSSLKVAGDIPGAHGEWWRWRRTAASTRSRDRWRTTGVRHVALADESCCDPAGGKDSAPAAGSRSTAARQGLADLATLPEADMVIIAIVGTGGLAPGARGDRGRQGHRRGQQGDPGDGWRGGDVKPHAPRGCRCCRSTASTTRFSSAWKVARRPMSRA